MVFLSYSATKIAIPNLRMFTSSKWPHMLTSMPFSFGTFEQTTNDEENVYVSSNGNLYLKPTLQDPSLIEKNTVIDLRGHGCTGDHWTDCVATTNVTNGTIINPVKSARINTKLGASIKYGRVEVTAKLPAGDWLWPSIILLPKNNTYGDWPQSGEIDIVQSRGNNYTYKQGGNNVIASCLHFGPRTGLDGWWRNNVKSTAYRETFSDRFHKFGVEVRVTSFCFRFLLTPPVDRQVHLHVRRHSPPSGHVHTLQGALLDVWPVPHRRQEWVSTLLKHIKSRN